MKVQQDNLALLRRNHGVVHDKESDKDFKNLLNFCLFTYFFKFPICLYIGFSFHLKYVFLRQSLVFNDLSGQTIKNHCKIVEYFITKLT